MGQGVHVVSWGAKTFSRLFLFLFWDKGVREGKGRWGEENRLNKTTKNKIRNNNNNDDKTRRHNGRAPFFWVGREGEVWKGDNIDVVLPCLEMNELASEPRSLYPALKDKEGGERNKEGQKNKKGRVNKRCRSTCAITQQFNHSCQICCVQNLPDSHTL